VPPAKRSNPGRALALVLILLAILYGAMALGHTYSPALGLDLRGGTTVTLTAKETVSGAKITKANLDTAVAIMRERVNGAGVGNADVATEGTRNIVVSVPGKNTEGVLKNIGETALLSIRQVYESNAPGTSGTDVPDTSSTTPSTAPTPQPSAAGSTAPSAGTSPSAAASPSGAASPKSMGGVGESGSGFKAQPAAFVHQAASGAPSAPASAPASETPSTSGTAAKKPETTPSAAELAEYASLDCTKPENQQGNSAKDDPNKFLVTCGNPDGSPVWYKYILHPTLIPGSGVSTASAQYATQGSPGWTVQLTFKSGPAKTWADFTSKHIGTLTSIVLDGNVFSTEVIQGAITGPTQISGNFSHKQASDLANVLKYGALPLAFDQATAQTISPTLGSAQLHAGLLAGVIGLILVLLYSFFYYRGLSLVTVTSLALSAAIQYPIIVLLGKGIGYTLTLAGIAGLIVAVGVTADSFIVFFERLRDEVREGNTLRSAVEKGWVRARRTIVSADLVSLIAAVILYWLAIGDVRGFAFTLGLSTFVDLFIVFFFTKPLITLLGRTKFFGNGHRLSGLDASRLGVDKLKTTATISRRPAPVRKV